MASSFPHKTHVLVVNEPRSYREVIAESVRSLRPDIEVLAAGPEELDDLVSHFPPDIVVCSQALPAVRENAQVWIELYPEHAAHSIVSFHGKPSIVEDIQLSDILDVIDQEDRLAQKS